MALSDLAVFSDYAYSAMTETVDQQIEKFNGASRGAITLQSGAMVGDYSDQAHWAKISGLVRRRNAYGTGAVAAKNLVHLVDTMVKVAAGTPPINIDPGMFQWIQRSPEEAGATIGQQLAGDMLADMLNTAIMGVYAALSQVSAVIYDATGQTTKTLIPIHLNAGAAKFGDRAQDIVVWLCHSKTMFDYWGSNITNAANLFTYGTVAVVADPFGRIFVITDSSALLNAVPATHIYHNLGLVAGAVQVEQNPDFLANEETKNGDENILKTYQAQWSYNMGIKGFAWDKTHGGKSPNDAALAVATNWDQYATSNKDLAGVIVETN